MSKRSIGPRVWPVSKANEPKGDRYKVNGGSVRDGEIGTQIPSGLKTHILLQFADGYQYHYPPRLVSKVEVIDCTPSWSGITPWLVALLTESTPGSAGYKEAVKHLQRMAEVADKYVTFVKGVEHEGSTPEETDPPRRG